MDDITVSVSKRVINPQKIAVKQFEANTKILKFRLDDYRVDQVDLRNYKAYAVTSIKGFIDTVELAMTSDATGITLVWSLGERTLRYAGVITYQIVFKENAEDTTSVYNTYEAIIQCSESIDGDHQISADCPTVLQQHFYLMQTLSGYFGSDVTYMPVGESIPLEERLDGRIYYQWFEKPTVRAKCATGTVNLGERPYADCGLYINNVHICVDNTSEAAFAIESEAWVDAINNANCGVTAVNIDGGDDVVFKLSAKNVGSYGNDIPIKFDVAQYGELAGKTYSEGKLSGSRLSGGSDAQSGVTLPTGRFEDAHGNVLSELDNTIGEIKYFAHNKPLGNWLLCDGRAVSRTEYARLYNLIGTTWGNGDGSTTFNLPNLIGRTIWGATDAGKYIEAGLPNIQATIYTSVTANEDAKVSGAVRVGSGTSSDGIGGGYGITGREATIDASLASSIYGKSSTVQPPAATLRPFIKY